MNIYAETLTISDALSFPSTNVTIYAKELIFANNASITTTPLNWPDAVVAGKKGGKAGDITLYIKDFTQTGTQTRFIATGGNGQNSNSTPGAGGNGGRVRSTINVGGVSIGGGIGGNNGAGSKGSDGTYSIINREFEWLHPNYITAVIKHAKDAYLNSNNAVTDSIFKAYTGWMATYMETAAWKALSDHDERKMELVNANTEMQAVMSRIAQNLDYFGNPFGWAPRLSLEAYSFAFDMEIEHAINVMYLSYWLGKEADNNEELRKRQEDARKLIEAELDVNYNEINSLVALIPKLKDEAGDLQKKLNDLTDKIDDRYDQLRKKAEANVKKQNELNMWAGILKTIAVVSPFVPVVGPYISVGATAGYAILNLTTGASDTNGYADAVEVFFDKANDLKKIPAALKEPYINVDTYDKIHGTVSGLIESADDLYKVFTKSSVPSEQVQAELKKLLSQSKEFKQLIEESEVLNGNKEALLQKLVSTYDNITATSVSAQNNVTALDALRVDLSKGDSKRDLRVKQYLDAMDRSARERLLKYHYIVAKAYEYRMLDSYLGQLDLDKMIDDFKEVPVEKLNKEKFDSFKTTYKEQVSKVREAIVNYGRTENNVSTTIKLTAEDLKALNEGEDVILNIFERGRFDPNRENIRIINFTVEPDFDVDFEANPGAEFDLVMEHSGISKFRNKGETYYFNYTNSRNQQNPIYWGHTYTKKDAKSGTFETFTPSAADISLLFSLLEINNPKVMLYSRPSPWADIRIYRTNKEAKVEFKKLTFKLNYDFMLHSNNIDHYRYLDIYARDIDSSGYKLSPYIILSKEDNNNRSNGRTPVYRTYNANQTLTVEAQPEYGQWEFVNWTNRDGNVVFSEDAKITITLADDVVRYANYRWTGPMLRPDMVTVGSESGEKSITVKAQNIENEDIEWEANSNNPEWLTVKGTGSGLNNGTFTVIFTANPEEKERTGAITVIPNDEGVDPVVITVIQSKNTTAVVAVSGVSLNKTTLALTIGASEQLKATVTPSDATNKTVTWSSSNPDVATVAQDGTVTAVTAGTATITATTQDGGKTATCTATVRVENVTSAETSDAPLARIFPNPTDNKITIEFEAVVEYALILSDINGKVLLRQTVSNKITQLDMSNYPSGVYLLTIDDGKRQSTTRVVKN